LVSNRTKRVKPKFNLLKGKTMSGPKKTSYSISRQLREKRKRERNAKRLRQIDDITAELNQCTKHIQKLNNKYHQKANYISVRVQGWMNDVNVAINGDLRDAWRGLKGIKNYLNNQETRLTENVKREKKRQQQREKRIRESQQRAKQKEIEKKIKEHNIVSNKLNYIKSEIDLLENEFGDAISQILKKPLVWISEAELEIDENLQSAKNSIAGVEKFLESKKEHINSIRQNLIKTEKTKKIIESVRSIETDFSEIMNNAIKQRIQHFIKAVELNSENVNTLKQINEFKKQVSEKYDEYEFKKQDHKYVSETFADALGGEPKDDGDGGTVVSGEIDGVPITVNLNNSNNEIKMDTPTDGSCSRGLEALQNKLKDAQIELGDIKVVNTGQTIKNMNKPIRIKGKRLNA